MAKLLLNLPDELDAVIRNEAESRGLSVTAVIHAHCETPVLQADILERLHTLAAELEIDPGEVLDAIIRDFFATREAREKVYGPGEGARMLNDFALTCAAGMDTHGRHAYLYQRSYRAAYAERLAEALANEAETKEIPGVELQEDDREFLAAHRRNEEQARERATIAAHERRYAKMRVEDAIKKGLLPPDCARIRGANWDALLDMLHSGQLSREEVYRRAEAGLKELKG